MAFNYNVLAMSYLINCREGVCVGLFYFAFLFCVEVFVLHFFVSGTSTVNSNM